MSTTFKAPASGQPGILTLNIKDKNALFASYMPFITNGGLFIPTDKNFQLGDEVFVLLTLPEDAERVPVAGRVIWTTPERAQGKRIRGIGVQFSDQDNGTTQRRIETLLAGAINSDKPTHTM